MYHWDSKFKLVVFMASQTDDFFTYCGVVDKLEHDNFLNILPIYSIRNLLLAPISSLIPPNPDQRLVGRSEINDYCYGYDTIMSNLVYKPLAPLTTWVQIVKC
jgi:hypothetical protein